MRITRDGISQYLRDRKRAINTPGAPVPGMGGHHSYHKGKSGSNKSGALRKLNNEWSASGRKQEDEQRGINNRARHQHIAEALAELEEEREELTAEEAAWFNESAFWPMPDEYEDIWDREMV